MRYIVLLNSRTALIILLMGNSALSTLEAMPLETTKFDSTYQLIDSTHKSIAELLEAQGLEKTIALKRARSLFSSEDKNIEVKLHHLQTHSTLALSREEIDKALAKRALYQRPLRLDTYASLVGFLQEIKSHPLDNKMLDAIDQITTLNRSFS